MITKNQDTSIILNIKNCIKYFQSENLIKVPCITKFKIINTIRKMNQN